METAERLGKNDVDFTNNKRPGNESFNSLICSIILEGKYHPDDSTDHKREVVRRIQGQIASLNPPGRFLKNRQDRGTGLSFVLLSQQQIQQKILKALKKEWKRTHNRTTKDINDVDFTSDRHPGNDNFSLLMRTLVEDGSFSIDMDKTKRKDLVHRIRGYFASLDPPGRFIKEVLEEGKSSHEKRSYEILTSDVVVSKVNHLLTKEWHNKNHMDMAKVKSLWDNWDVKQKKAFEDEEECAMKKRYPKGTKIEMALRGKVTGYKPPNYQISWEDKKFRENLNEGEMQKFALVACDDSPMLPQGDHISTGDNDETQNSARLEAAPQLDYQTKTTTAKRKNPFVPIEREQAPQSDSQSSGEDNPSRTNLDLTPHETGRVKIKREILDYRDESHNPVCSPQRSNQLRCRGNDSNEDDACAGEHGEPPRKKQTVKIKIEPDWE